MGISETVVGTEVSSTSTPQVNLEPSETYQPLQTIFNNTFPNDGAVIEIPSDEEMEWKHYFIDFRP